MGVGKTTLGRAVSKEMGIGFIDGDDYSAPGHWLRSILQTSRRIVAACELQLESLPAVIVAYPLRCTNWLFYRETFRRRGISFYCIGLTAEPAHIANRERNLTSGEIERTLQMAAQGYGRRQFSDRIVRTDESSFELTRDRLIKDVEVLLGRKL